MYVTIYVTMSLIDACIHSFASSIYSAPIIHWECCSEQACQARLMSSWPWDLQSEGAFRYSGKKVTEVNIVLSIQMKKHRLL